jgi:asparagine synthase (glutamine-hydrolysing)
VRSEIIRPLLAPLRPRPRRWKDATDPWRDYSAINVAFARELDLTDRMRQQGHDPHFAREGGPRRVRSSLIRPGRSALGHMWLEVGGAHGLEVRDPTFDRRVMSFCWSIPESQFLRGDQDRLLIRRAMSGYLPEQVRWNRRRGFQASDRAQRVVDHRNDMEAALARLERSELARHYLDLPRMRRVFESVQHGIDSENSFQTQTVLGRGLMAGLFLLRFD